MSAEFVIEESFDVVYHDGRFGSLQTVGRNVKFAAELCLSKGKVLDIGCGTGTDVLYLAKRGFRAKGIDISRAKIDVLLHSARQQDLSVEAVVGDIDQEILRPEYHLMLCNYVLHWFDWDKAVRTIQKMQNNVVSGGINVIHVFGQGDMVRQKTYRGLCYFRGDQLAQLYKGWEYLTELEVLKKDFDKGLTNEVITLVCRKP